jgi:hypothetical protein
MPAYAIGRLQMKEAQETWRSRVKYSWYCRDMLRSQPVWWDHEMAHEVADPAQVTVASIGAVPTDAELFVHPVAESPHDVLLLAVKGVGRNGRRQECMAGGRTRNGEERGRRRARYRCRDVSLMTPLTSQSIGSPPSTAKRFRSIAYTRTLTAPGTPTSDATA